MKLCLYVVPSCAISPVCEFCCAFSISHCSKGGNLPSFWCDLVSYLCVKIPHCKTPFVYCYLNSNSPMCLISVVFWIKLQTGLCCDRGIGVPQFCFVACGLLETRKAAERVQQKEPTNKNKETCFIIEWV